MSIGLRKLLPAIEAEVLLFKQKREWWHRFDDNIIRLVPLKVVGLVQSCLVRSDRLYSVWPHKNWYVDTWLAKCMSICERGWSQEPNRSNQNWFLNFFSGSDQHGSMLYPFKRLPLIPQIYRTTRRSVTYMVGVRAYKKLLQLHSVVRSVALELYTFSRLKSKALSPSLDLCWLFGCLENVGKFLRFTIYLSFLSSQTDFKGRDSGTIEICSLF